jgi:hypothetical protein
MPTSGRGIRIEARRLAEVSDRFIKIASRPVGISPSQIGEKRRIRIKTNCGGEIGNGLVIVLLAEIDETPVYIATYIVGLEADLFVGVRKGMVVFSRLLINLCRSPKVDSSGAMRIALL